MNSSIEHLVYQVVARECDHSAGKKLDQIWESSKRILESMGITSKVYDNFDFYAQLEKNFRHRLVPNPQYWKKYFHSKMAFFLVRAHSKRYDILLQLVETRMPTVSYFVCYGELDVIIRVVGDDDIIEKVGNLLSENGFPPSEITVEAIPLFYDVKLNHHKNFRKPTLTTEVVEHALASNIQDIEVETINELEDAGVSIGTVYYETSHVTGRIRAFIGLKFEVFFSRSQCEKFEEKLVELNDEEEDQHGSRPLSSIYRCAGFYQYILEVICDNQAQLDRVTDTIQNVNENVEDSETLILAKAFFVPFSFSEKPQGELGKFVVLRNVFDKKLYPLAEKLTDHWPKLESVFLASNPENQFSALYLYDNLVEENKDLEELSHPMLNEYISDFIRYVLEGKSKAIQNTGLGVIRDVVEEEHKQLIQIILDQHFNGNAGELQKAIKADNSLWEKWGLAKWAYYYKDWHKNGKVNTILQIPDDVQQCLSNLGLLRNRLAHNAHVGKTDSLITQVRECFHYTYTVLLWINESKLAINISKIIHSQSGEVVQMGIPEEYLQMISDINFKQNEIYNIVASMRNQTDVRWKGLALTLEEIRTGTVKLDRKTETIIKELVIPQMNEKDRGNAQKVLDFLVKTPEAIPAEVIVTILAGLIARALGMP